MEEKLKYKKIFSTIAGVVLLLAIPSIWPYFYFQLLRWIVAGTAIFNGYIAYELKKTSWVWIMGIIALLFNPIFPFYLSKEIWIVIDLIASILMFVSVKKIK
ncbi:MAG: hypothetical protein Q8R36_03230 [bacterium]|nr:hypothetical protein [bacterium]